MAIYQILDGKSAKGVVNNSGSNEQSACEIYSAMNSEEIIPGEYMAVDFDQAESLLGIVGSTTVGQIDIDPAHFSLWRRRYREIYLTAYELSQAARNLDRHGVVISAEKLTDLLEDAPELGDYELTDRMGIDRCIKDLWNEEVAVDQIVGEFEDIFKCVIK